MRKGRSKLDQVLAYGEGARAYHPTPGHAPYPAPSEIHAPYAHPQQYGGYPHSYAGAFAPPPTSPAFTYPGSHPSHTAPPAQTPDMSGLRETLERMQQRLQSLSQARAEAPKATSQHSPHEHQQQADLLSRHHREVMDAIGQLRHLADGTDRALAPQRAELENLRSTLEHQFSNIERQLSAGRQTSLDPQAFISAIETSHLELSREIANLRQKLDESNGDPNRIASYFDRHAGELHGQIARLEEALESQGNTNASVVGGVDELRRELTELRDGLDRVEAFTMAPNGSSQELDTIGLRLEEITRAVIALSSNEAGIDQFQRIEARLSDLAHALDEVSNNSNSVEDQNQIDALANQIAGLSIRLETVNETVADFGSQIASPAAAPELTELAAGMAAINQRLDVLASDFKDQQSGDETLSNLQAGFSSLQSQMAAMSDELLADRNDDTAFLAATALESKIIDLGSQLGDLHASINAKDDQSKLSDLQTSLDDVRRSVQAISSRPVAVPVEAGNASIDLSGFENRMLDMSRAIDEMANKPVAVAFEPQVLNPLEAQLASMAEKLDSLSDAPSEPAEMNALLERLGQIEANIADLGNLPADNTPLDSFNNIENQLAEVIIRLEAAEETASPQLDMAPLSDRLLSIEQQLASSRDISIDLAKSAAEDAVRQTVAILPTPEIPTIDEGVLGALAEDVRQLTTASNSASRDHMATFEAVRETLTVMNERLEGVERHLSSGFSAMQSSIDDAGIGKHPAHFSQMDSAQVHTEADRPQEISREPAVLDNGPISGLEDHSARKAEEALPTPTETAGQADMTDQSDHGTDPSQGVHESEASYQLGETAETLANEYPLAGLVDPVVAPVEPEIVEEQVVASFEGEGSMVAVEPVEMSLASHGDIEQDQHADADTAKREIHVETENEAELETEIETQPVSGNRLEPAKPLTAGASLVMAARAALAGERSDRTAPSIEIPEEETAGNEPVPVAVAMAGDDLDAGPELTVTEFTLSDPGLPEVDAPQLASTLPPETPPPPVPLDEDPLIHEDAPLEPGSGVPDLADLVRKAHEYRKEAARSGDSASVNEFRAIAQRAAQAAAAEASLAEQEMPVAKKPGLFSNLPDLLKRNKKVVIVAGAAVLLAGISVPLAGKFTGGTFGEETSVFGDSEPVSEEAVIVEEASPIDIIEEPVDQGAVADGAIPLEQQTETVESVNFLQPVDEGITEVSPSLDLDTQAVEAVKPLAFGAEPPALTNSLVDQASLTQAQSLVENPSEDGVQKAPDPGFGSPELRQAAQEGNPAAMFEIARRYTDGRGIEKNMAKAAAWYERAANMGFAPAQYVIGNFHEKGAGRDKDLEKAADWYVKAADAGNIVAMHNLAVLHATPGALAETPDMTEAFKWFEQAADNGIRDSQVNLGIFYTKGIGTERDLIQAYKWFAVAGKSGDKDANSKRDVIGEALRPEQLEEAREIVKAWRPAERNMAANDVTVEEAWKSSGAPVAQFKPDRKMVQVVQAALGKLGYNAGPPDGLAGERTRKAVSAFQKKSGLTVNGQINPEVILELQKLAKSG